MQNTRDEGTLKTNALPFPALKHAPPDLVPPSLLRGFVTLAVLLVVASLFGLTIWSLITL